MPFEKQKKAGGGRGSEDIKAKISIRKSNSIGINQTAVDEYLEDEPEYCEIHWDSVERKLGLGFVDEETEYSYKVSYGESGATITPTAFLKSEELVPEVTKQYRIDTAELDDGTELLVIDVDDHISTYGYPDSNDEQDEA